MGESLNKLRIYLVDVQGLSGKKVEVKFFPKSQIKWISFETVDTLDFDADIKIGVAHNTVVTQSGVDIVHHYLLKFLNLKQKTQRNNKSC